MKIDLEAQRLTLEKYNGFYDGGRNNNPFGPWQGVGNGQAWCDSSAQYGAVEGGGFDGWDARCQFGHKGSAYVPFTIDDAKRIGLWRAKGSGYVPKAGDQEIYDWEGNGVADHIAGRFIAKRPDGTHVTWEGNHNDRAGYVIRDDKYVLGWVALSEVAVVAPPAPTPAPTPQEGKDVYTYEFDGGLWITDFIWYQHIEDPSDADLGWVKPRVKGHLGKVNPEFHRDKIDAQALAADVAAIKAKLAA